MPVCRALPDDVASQRLNNAHLHRIASLVSACLGCCDIHANSPSMSCLSPCWPSLSAIPSKSFVVSPSALVRVGFPWRHQVSACPKPRTRAAIAKWGVRRIDPAGLATLLLPGAVGKLVYIEEDIKELDWSAISASIDSDPFFSRDGPRLAGHAFSSAWHAARVHHQCRLMGVPEAACERVGSTMKMVWNKNQPASVSTLMDIALLATAGVTCVGTQLDEELCNTVAETMVRLGKSAPTVSKKTEARRKKSGVTVSRAVMNFREDAVKALRQAGRCNILGVDQQTEERVEEDEESYDEGGYDEDGDETHNHTLVKFSRDAVDAVAGHQGTKRMAQLEQDIASDLVKANLQWFCHRAFTMSSKTLYRSSRSLLRPSVSRDAEAVLLLLDSQGHHL